MAKIYSSDLHGNDNASISFGAAVIAALEIVREDIATLADSRNADVSAPGSLHALRKLCDGEDSSVGGSLQTDEIEEWRKLFFKWFDRVKVSFPVKLRNKFRANAEDDFRVLLAAAVDLPGQDWWQKAQERHIRLTFRDKPALEAARKAAKEKHPVGLGSPLHKYLEQCVKQLVGDIPVDTPAPKSQPARRPPGSMAPRLVCHDDGTFALYVDDFDSLSEPADLEQDMVVEAYDLERAVKAYLRKHNKSLLDELDFDSESSMFVACSGKLPPLVKVTDVLFRFAADRKLRQQFLRKRR